MAITILSYLSIFLFSLSVSSLIIGMLYPDVSFLDVFHLKIKPIAKKLLFSAGLSIGVGMLTAFGLSKIQDWRHDKNVESTNGEIGAVQVELYEKALIKEKYTQLRNDKIIHIIQNFLHANYLENTELVNGFYSFPVKKFYTYRNVSKEKVDERNRYYWRHHSDPEFKVSDANTEIIPRADGTFVININMKQRGLQTIYLNIKMDSSYKIYSIGNSIVTDQDKILDTIPKLPPLGRK